MKNLSKYIPKESIKKEKPLIIGLIIFFIACILFPFFTQNFNNAIKVNILSIQTGSLYAILALGFSLIYGVAKQLKLSLGGYFVLAAYCQFFLLETMDISPTLRTDIDGILLLALVFLPVILILIIFIFLLKVLRIRKFILVLLSTLISGVSTIVLSNLVEGIYVGLAITLLNLSAWYLEFPPRETTIGTLIFSFSIPIMILIGFPVVYLSLMLVTVIFTAFVAILSDRYLLDKVRHSHISVMIVTFALALIFQSFVQVVYFPQNGSKFTRFQSIDWSFPGIVPNTDNTTIFGTTIPTIRLISLIFSIIAVILLYAFITFSRTGIALRAVSQDEEAASLAGIDIRKTTAIVSGIGMGLAGFAAVLTSSFSARPLWNPFMGWPVLIWSIAVVTLGGMGSLIGSVVAAFMIGYLEILVSTVNPSLSVAIPFIIVIVVMIIKPEGLFGERKEME